MRWKAVAKVQRWVELSNDLCLDGAERVPVVVWSDGDLKMLSHPTRHPCIARGFQPPGVRGHQLEPPEEQGRECQPERRGPGVSTDGCCPIRLARVADDFLPDGHFVAPAWPTW